ncbi:hypothetical protein BACSTE_00570 [Bacteroides stercoris ATCC 43183]|uniref:Uncharacterized protein n=1 Tax=Bacteroides stercoris ATCC 43183 TaxID=449673 RepID=B0NM68_BACSE|nr:hypothetical protein BACSTE_00570 [Bacteroides stercoris ATCC 43183]
MHYIVLYCTANIIQYFGRPIKNKKKVIQIINFLIRGLLFQR